ncbi:MAG: dTDP-4-dehydrorhamnose 3,5-epimerase [Actinomycetota bacterium]
MAEVMKSDKIDGVYVVRLEAHPDERGRFVETFRRRWIPGAREMVQGNRSDSQAGVLRGIHYHLFQSDYWYVPSGRTFTALVDLRPKSPTYKAVETLEMGEQNEVGVYIPPGVGHGFYALTPAVMTYLVDQEFDGSDEFGVRFDDETLGIPWPDGERIVSDRDRANPALTEITAENLPE